MKVPNWLYFILVVAGMGVVALFLTLFFLFLFASTFHGLEGSDVLYLFYVFLYLAPYLISLPPAYVLVLRRIHSPTQRRLLNSGTISLTGAVMFLSGFSVLFSGVGVSNSYAYAAVFELVTGPIGLVGMLLGVGLALPQKKPNVEPRGRSAEPEHPSSTLHEIHGYLPAAAIATLTVTILTALVPSLAVLTALSPCYSSPATCLPTPVIIIGFLSSLGVAAGIAATYTLLKGRYRPTVPLALVLLILSPLFIFVMWPDLFLLAIPLLILCEASMALTIWSQKESIKTPAWIAGGVLSASLSAIALAEGSLEYSLDAWDNTCLGVWIRPYLLTTELLVSIGISGMIIALMMAYSARIAYVKEAEFATVRKNVGKSKIFRVLLILLSISLISTTIFAAGFAASNIDRCRNTFCYNPIEQLYISQATPGPLSNQVTFTVANVGTSDIRISEVQVQVGGISTPTYASQLSTSMVCVRSSNTILVATFPGVTFVKGTTYNFRLVSADGRIFPYAYTA